MKPSSSTKSARPSSLSSLSTLSSLSDQELGNKNNGSSKRESNKKPSRKKLTDIPSNVKISRNSGRIIKPTFKALGLGTRFEQIRQAVASTSSSNSLSYSNLKSLEKSLELEVARLSTSNSSSELSSCASSSSLSSTGSYKLPEPLIQFSPTVTTTSTRVNSPLLVPRPERSFSSTFSPEYQIAAVLRVPNNERSKSSTSSSNADAGSSDLKPSISRTEEFNDLPQLSLNVRKFSRSSSTSSKYFTPTHSTHSTPSINFPKTTRTSSSSFSSPSPLLLDEVISLNTHVESSTSRLINTLRNSQSQASAGSSSGNPTSINSTPSISSRTISTSTLNPNSKESEKAWSIEELKYLRNIIEELESVGFGINFKTICFELNKHFASTVRTERECEEKWKDFERVKKDKRLQLKEMELEKTTLPQRFNSTAGSSTTSNDSLRFERRSSQTQTSTSHGINSKSRYNSTNSRVSEPNRSYNNLSNDLISPEKEAREEEAASNLFETFTLNTDFDTSSHLPVASYSSSSSSETLNQTNFVHSNANRSLIPAKRTNSSSLLEPLIRKNFRSKDDFLEAIKERKKSMEAVV